MTLTESDLIYVLQEQVSKELILNPGERPDATARRIGFIVRDIMKRLSETMLPVTLGPPREVHVDWDQRILYPPFRVTMRW